MDLHFVVFFQIQDIDSGILEVNTFVAKTTISSLAKSTSTVDTMFGNDINITFQLLNKMLAYEKGQSGLSLTSEQDSLYLTVSILNFYVNHFQNHHFDEVYVV